MANPLSQVHCSGSADILIMRGKGMSYRQIACETGLHHSRAWQIVSNHASASENRRIILKAAEGKSNTDIARELNQSIDMVRLWRRRWHELEPIAGDDLSAEERLDDLPRPGAPTRFSADQLCQIEQVVCEGPEKSGRPISQWTGREIAGELVARGIVESISARHAARLLKKRDCSRT